MRHHHARPPKPARTGRPRPWTTPRANPELDIAAVRRSLAQLERVLGH